MRERNFDVEMIIELIKEQEPRRPELIDQLKKLGKSNWSFQPYVQFVPGNKPNQTGSPWQFKENIVLEHPNHGTIVLDILKDGRIGGLEFLKLIKAQNA